MLPADHAIIGHHREARDDRSTKRECAEWGLVLARTVTMADNALRPMRLNGHTIGLLKDYMRDLVDQAQQEAQEQRAFGFTTAPYAADQALSDLLAILDDRIESEGVQVGLSEDVLHQMWTICDQAQAQIKDRVWMEAHAGEESPSKAVTRELTYRALLDFIENP